MFKIVSLFFLFQLVAFADFANTLEDTASFENTVSYQKDTTQNLINSSNLNTQEQKNFSFILFLLKKTNIIEKISIQGDML